MLGTHFKNFPDTKFWNFSFGIKKLNYHGIISISYNISVPSAYWWSLNSPGKTRTYELLYPHGQKRFRLKYLYWIKHTPCKLLKLHPDMKSRHLQLRPRAMKFGVYTILQYFVIIKYTLKDSTILYNVQYSFLKTVNKEIHERRNALLDSKKSQLVLLFLGSSLFQLDKIGFEGCRSSIKNQNFN